jgi:hypothetical protein
MKNLFIFISFIVFISCNINKQKSMNYCPSKYTVETIEGVCEVRFSKLYGDDIYLLDNVSINYNGHKYLISSGLYIWDKCPKLNKKYGNDFKNINFERLYPWLGTTIKGNNSRLYSKQDTMQVYLIYGLQLQVLKIRQNDVPNFSARHRCFLGFMDITGIDDSYFIVPIRHDSIFEATPKYLQDSMFSKIFLKQDFSYFSED